MIGKTSAAFAAIASETGEKNHIEISGHKIVAQIAGEEVHIEYDAKLDQYNVW